MKEIIQIKYNELYLNSAEFRIFVENMEKYSTEEIISLYGLNSVLISCDSVHSEMQA